MHDASESETKILRIGTNPTLAGSFQEEKVQITRNRNTNFHLGWCNFTKLHIEKLGSKINSKISMLQINRVRCKRKAMTTISIVD